MWNKDEQVNGDNNETRELFKTATLTELSEGFLHEDIKDEEREKEEEELPEETDD